MFRKFLTFCIACPVKLRSNLFGIIFIFIFTLLIFNFAEAALVPCGPGVGEACAWCDLYKLADNILNFMVVTVVFPVAAIMIVVGGIFMMTSAGSEKRWAQGKTIATAAVVGILIALLSYLIIDIIIKYVAVGWNGLNIDPWNEIKCP